MSVQTSANKSRLIQLDILRGIAILLVLGRHPVLAPEDAGLFLPWAGLWERFGWTGVDLFFVLSGFLVGGLLLNELRTRSALDVKRFIIRRGFKIWPSYYFYLLCLLIVFRTDPGQAHVSVWRHLMMLFPSLLHVQNYLGTPDKREHLWSLAVEEHFYLLLPLLLLCVAGWSKKRPGSYPAIPWIAGAVIVGCTALRCLVNAHRPFSFETHAFPTHLRIDGLFFGVLLAYFYHFKPDFLARIARRRSTLLIAAFALIGPMIVLKWETTPFVSTFGYTMLYLGYGCLLLVLVYTPIGVGRLGRALNSPGGRLIAWIGQFSYPIYLWHQDLARYPLQFLVRQGLLADTFASVRWLAVVALYVLMASLGGAFLSLLVERPALALRDRLFPARARALAEEQAPSDTADIAALPAAEYLPGSPHTREGSQIVEASA